jgi:hypothetical protein
MSKRLIVRDVVTIFSILLLVFTFAGCESYKQQVVPFKLPAAYPNVTTVADAQIAAQSYDDPQQAQEAFGFDIRGPASCRVRLFLTTRERIPWKS